MKLEAKKAINELVENLVDEIATELEENRFYPSVREAGTAPTESAIEQCYEFTRKFLIAASGLIKDQDVSSAFKSYTIDEIKVMINGENMEEFEELESVESFVDGGNLNEKYVYLNEVFKHKPSGVYLMVITQRVNDRDRDFISLVSVSEVNKKEVVTYEWS